MRTRSLRVVIGGVTVTPRWDESTITIQDWVEHKEVVLVIRDPGALRYLRKKLDEIEAGWKAQLYPGA
jgi:hypothetical protein